MSGFLFFLLILVIYSIWDWTGVDWIGLIGERMIDRWLADRLFQGSGGVGDADAWGLGPGGLEGCRGC